MRPVLTHLPVCDQNEFLTIHRTLRWFVMMSVQRRVAQLVLQESSTSHIQALDMQAHAKATICIALCLCTHTCTRPCRALFSFCFMLSASPVVLQQFLTRRTLPVAVRSFAELHPTAPHL